jgi:hypothetical protein
MKNINPNEDGHGTLWGGLMRALRIPLNRREIVKSVMHEYLSQARFPANKKELLRAASEQQAPENVMSGLKHLEDRNYGSLEEVADSFDPRRIS